MAEIEYRVKGRWILEDALPPVLAVCGFQNSADLGGQHIAIAWYALKGAADADFALARAVKRGRIEQVEAELESGVNDGLGLLLRYVSVESAQRGTAQSESCDFEATATQYFAFKWIHR